MITVSQQTKANIAHRSMLLNSRHGTGIELYSAKQRGLTIHSLQQVCWRRDESKDTACQIAALQWYQITQKHRTHLWLGCRIQMLSDPVCRAITGTHLISQGLLCEFFTFLTSRPAEAHHTAIYTLRCNKGDPLLNATEQRVPL